MVTFTLEEYPGVRFPWYGRPPINLWVMLKQYTYKRDNGVCQYCQEPTEYIDTHCHHVLELSEGGTNHPSNLKTLCRRCHKQRHPFMKSAREKLCGEGVERHDEAGLGAV
jgi:5-methylcytosine-specific restriction endonuclease McrA